MEKYTAIHKNTQHVCHNKFSLKSLRKYPIRPINTDEITEGAILRNVFVKLMPYIKYKKIGATMTTLTIERDIYKASNPYLTLTISVGTSMQRCITCDKREILGLPLLR